MKRLLFLIVFTLLVSCTDKGGSSGGGVQGIDKTGTWVPRNPFVTCYTDSTLSTVDASSALNSSDTWRIEVDGNSVTELQQDNDCSIEYNYKAIVSSESMEFSNFSVSASPSPCEVTMNYDDLVDFTTADYNFATGETIIDHQVDSVTSDQYLIFRNPDLETGVKICLMVFEKI